MSQENVELIRSVYEPLNRGDWDEVFRNAHPEMEPVTQRGPAVGTFRGQEAIKTQVREGFAAFEAWRIQPEEFFEAGGRWLDAGAVSFLKPMHGVGRQWCATRAPVDTESIGNNRVKSDK
jgi:ketosteroid isomerase-like protein